MVDVRKILIIFVVGILYAIFVNSFIDAVYEAPEYDEFCDVRAVPIMNKDCEPIPVPKCYGQLEYEYDSNNCPISVLCNECNADYREARESYNLVVFIISSIFGLLAIVAALYLPLKKNVIQWIATGFMLGGLVSIFIGTARYYADMARLLRPFIILIELLIIIYVSYKKIK